MPLVRDQAAATHGRSSGLTNELTKHPKGRELYGNGRCGV